MELKQKAKMDNLPCEFTSAQHPQACQAQMAFYLLSKSSAEMRQKWNWQHAKISPKS